MYNRRAQIGCKLDVTEDRGSLTKLVGLIKQESRHRHIDRTSRIVLLGARCYSITSSSNGAPLKIVPSSLMQRVRVVV